jgi:uncharacterized protein YegP (UPF0339 family)
MADDTVHFYQDEAGEYRWKRVAPNGETVADSGEGYINLQDCADQAVQMFGQSVTYVHDD